MIAADILQTARAQTDSFEGGDRARILVAVDDPTLRALIRDLLDPRRDIELSARLGTRLGDNSLAYVKAGYSNLRLREKTTLKGVTTSDTNNLNGVQLGAGAEVAIMPDAYLKSEYRYGTFGSNDPLICLKLPLV